jgi:hypothetical protein
MVKAKDIIKEFVPYITLSKSPKKPAKLPKFNVFYWHRRYTTHKPLKQNTHIWDKVKNGDFAIYNYKTKFGDDYISNKNKVLNEIKQFVNEFSIK